MPELPEVETTRRGVQPFLTGQIVRDVIVREGRLRWGVPPHLADTLRGLRVERVERRAKYLLIGFETGTLIIHLGMSGSLRIVEHDLPAQKHDHIDFVLQARTLRYRDPRRFGAVLWHIGPIELHPLLRALGPEPLGDDFSGEVLFRATRAKRTAIKLLLMNNSVVVGVGNIYANEALFAAGIHPARQAGALGRAECEALAHAIRDILERAIAAGGSTLRDFVDAEGKPGYFQQTYHVYGRSDTPCDRCGTPICHMRQGQRSTFYCPNCQPC